MGEILHGPPLASEVPDDDAPTALVPVSPPPPVRTRTVPYGVGEVPTNVKHLCWMKTKSGPKLNWPEIVRLVGQYFPAIAESDGSLREYHGGVYRPVRSEVWAQHALRRLLGMSPPSGWVGELAARFTAERPVLGALGQPAEMLAANFIGFVNGNIRVADLGEWPPPLLLHDHRLPLIIQHPVFFDPDSDCPRFHEWLSGRVDDQTVDLVYQLIGQCLYRGRHPARAPFLVGPGGSGKSTLLDVLIAIIGKENISATRPSELGERFKAASLQGMAANVVAETGRLDGEDIAVFKMAVSGDILEAERKHRDPFKFIPNAVWVISANKVPQASNIDSGFLRRVLLVEMDRVIQYSRRRAYDEQLAELTTPEELAGIVNRSLQTIAHVVKSGYTLPASSVRFTDEYRKTRSIQARFLIERTEHAPGHRISGNLLRKLFDGWLDSHKLEEEKRRPANWRMRDLYGAALDLDIPTSAPGARKALLDRRVKAASPKIASEAPDASEIE